MFLKNIILFICVAYIGAGPLFAIQMQDNKIQALLEEKGLSLKNITDRPAQPNRSIGGLCKQAAVAAVNDTFLEVKYTKYHWGVSSWINDTMTTQAVSEDGLLQGYRNYYWKTSTGSWANIDSISFAFDNQRQTIRRQRWDWNTSYGMWANGALTAFAYSVDGLSDTASVQSWNTYTGSWENSLRAVTRYSSIDKSTITYLRYDLWDASTGWSGFILLLGTVNTRNQLTGSTMQYWSTNIGGWVNSSKDTIIYNVDNVLSKKIEMEWNSSYGVWANDSNLTVTYSGDSAVFMKQYWNTNVGAWTNTYRKIYIMHAGTQEDSIRFRQNWSSSLGNWISNEQLLFTWDNQGNLSQDSLMYWSSYTGNWVNSIKKIWEYKHCTWNNAAEIVPQSSVTDNITIGKAGGRLIFKGMKDVMRIDIFDPCGRKIDGIPISSSGPAYCTSRILPANGMFFIRFTLSHGNAFVRKAVCFN